MMFTILFDLDDTLRTNRTDQFLSAYLSSTKYTPSYPTDPVIMVGNDPENDIIPASQVGILPFFYHEDDQSVPSEAAAHGNFDDLEEWFENLPAFNQGFPGQSPISMQFSAQHLLY